MPLKSLFRDYNNAFLTFTTSLEKISKYHNEASYVELELEMMLRTWKSFAYGIRIDKHHPYYNKKTEYWKQMFSDDIIRLKRDLRRFDRLSNPKSSLNNYEFSEISKKILSSTVGNYIK